LIEALLPTYKGAMPLKWKIFEFALLFFLACFLIYFGTLLLLKIWRVIAIIAAILAIAVVAYRIWKFKHSL